MSLVFSMSLPKYITIIWYKTKKASLVTKVGAFWYDFLLLTINDYLFSIIGSNTSFSRVTC